MLGELFDVHESITKDESDVDDDAPKDSEEAGTILRFHKVVRSALKREVFAYIMSRAAPVFAAPYILG